tara:strand:+ start:1138 stop:1293 length:156 start_codon:yes stop_codon:yes gene_type:complete
MVLDDVQDVRELLRRDVITRAWPVLLIREAPAGSAGMQGEGKNKIDDHTKY